MTTHSDHNIAFVPETRIGFWFLGTHTWTRHVLCVAIKDLERLIPKRKPSYPIILDAGCGQGKSFRLLIEQFSPRRVIGVDAEEKCLQRARVEASKENVPIELRHCDIAVLDMPDATVDLVFCHQTFHHLTQPQRALEQFYRVLKPGGLLLFAESTRVYIQSWIIRLLFRHPMHLQRSATEYMAIIRAHGFTWDPQNVSLPYLWWSRPDLGAFEFFGFGVPEQREETLINLAAVKPE
ncbi:MAG: methyltransferase domain-containing protein [Deltaproteobacteria bacterium]|nr:methyltransferase domain-containing protein [Deltaproteobacteria bacterium]